MISLVGRSACGSISLGRSLALSCSECLGWISVNCFLLSVWEGGLRSEHLFAEKLFKLYSLEALLGFQLLLDVLVSLKHCVLLNLSGTSLETNRSIALLSQSVHLVLLFWNEEGLCCDNFLLPNLYVFVLLFSLKIRCLLLHFLSLDVLLLSCKLVLNFLEI